MTVGLNMLQHNGNTSAPTADLTTLKLLINSVASTSKVKFMMLDIKNYYLATTLAEKTMHVHPSGLSSRRNTSTLQTPIKKIK